MQQIKKVLKLSVLQAISASVVVWLWSQVMTHGEQWFGKEPTNSIGIVAVLLIFIITAVLSAGAVLGYPLYLAFHKKDWPKAVTLLGMTIVWLAIVSAILICSFAK